MVGPDLMAAPIVTEGKISRNVYFPEVSWYNLHSGTKYKPGTSVIENISLTSKVPLFLR